MRYLTSYLFLLGCTRLYAQQNMPLPDMTLNKVIIESVLTKDQPRKPVFVYTTNDKSSVAYILKHHPSPFWGMITSTFYLSENWIIKKLLDNTYTLDTSASTAANIRFLNRKKVEEENIDVRKLTGTDRVIDELFILYDKNRGKCLVYFHAVADGNSIARLESRNGVWKVISFNATSLN